MGSIRIVGGSLGGRRLKVPRDGPTRPTSERVREALASVLSSRDDIAEARVLDLFAGTGALGFELLSRGATSALLVDSDRRAIATIRANASQLGVTDQMTTRALDLLSKPATAARQLVALGPYDLVVADPPYAELSRIPPLLAALVAEGGLTAGATVVVEHASRDAAPPIEGLETDAAYRYGDTAVTLYEAVEEAR